MLPKMEASSRHIIRVSAPGSIMLLGEHAVLHGEPAIVCAVSRRLYVTLTPRHDGAILLRSDRFGSYETDIKLSVPFNPGFRFVLEAIKTFAHKLTQGFELEIRSDFSDQLGLGSSAAVTVATLFALQNYVDQKTDLRRIYELGLQVIQTVQGMGSGADVAASTYGGTVFYRVNPLVLKPLPFKPPIELFYCGYKMKTVDVVKRVKAVEKRQAPLFEKLYQLIGACVQRGEQAICERDFRSLGELFDIHQGLQRSLGVSDETLSAMIYALKREPNVLGAKISGSGLGDCVVAVTSGARIGNPLTHIQGAQKIDVRVTSKGVSFE